MANYLADYDWSHMFSVNLTVDAIWSAFSEILYNAIDIFLPTSTYLLVINAVNCIPTIS